MKKRTKANLRQEAYTHNCLEKGGLIDRLNEHWGSLIQIEMGLRENDIDRLKAAVGTLDMELIRYALGALNTHLREAAIRDSGVLLAESVLDTALDQAALERWRDWLSAADFWPVFARENWQEATAHAADEVLGVLDADGVLMDEEARRSIYRDVLALDIRDLITQELAEKFFPPATEADGNDF